MHQEVPKFLGQILDRYNILNWFLDPVNCSRKSASSSTDNLMPPEHQLAMAEECLLLLIWLVTELPAPPLADTQDLRRDMLHRLCTKNCTHSELQKCKRYSARSRRVSQATFDSTLSSIALQKRSGNSGTSMFELKQSLFAEYDPSFWHLIRKVMFVVFCECH